LVDPSISTDNFSFEVYRLLHRAYCTGQRKVRTIEHIQPESVKRLAINKPERLFHRIRKLVPKQHDEGTDRKPKFRHQRDV